MTTITTPVGRLAYTYLEKPDEGREFSDGKYKTNVIFDKGDNLVELENAVTQAAKDKFGDDVDMTKLTLPFRDGDDKENPTFKGCWYINPKSKYPVKVVGPTGAEIEAKYAYAGCYARVRVKVDAYKAGANKGVTLYLNGVQFVKHGDKLGETSTGFDEIKGDDPLEGVWG